MKRILLVVLVSAVASCGSDSPPMSGDLSSRFSASQHSRGVVDWTAAMIQQFEQPGDRELEFVRRESVDDTTWTATMQRDVFYFRRQEPLTPVLIIERWSLDPETEQFSDYVLDQIVRVRMKWTHGPSADQVQFEAMSLYLDLGFPAGLFTFLDRKDVEFRFSHQFLLGFIVVQEWDNDGYRNTFELYAGLEFEEIDSLLIWFYVMEVWIIHEGEIGKINWSLYKY